MARLASTPYLGYLIINDQMKAACALLFIAGSSDALDGWIARRRGSFTVFGSIADPAADKALMTTMVVALGWRGLLPRECILRFCVSYKFCFLTPIFWRGQCH